MKTITVGKTSYKVEPFTPKEAIPFGLKVAKILGPTLAGVVDKGTLEERLTNVINRVGNIDESAVESLMNMAYSRVYTPENECLDNEASFNAWFKDHRDELFECGFKAIMALATDFLPAGLKSLTPA